MSRAGAECVAQCRGLVYVEDGDVTAEKSNVYLSSCTTEQFSKERSGLWAPTLSEFPLNRSVFPGVSALLIVERLFANVSIQIRLMDLHFFSAFPVC